MTPGRSGPKPAHVIFYMQAELSTSFARQRASSTVLLTLTGTEAGDTVDYPLNSGVVREASVAHRK